MSISLFEALGVRFELSSEEEIAIISASWLKIKKVRTLCFLKLLKLNERNFKSLRKQSKTLRSQTLKVEEKKVSLVFQSVAQEPKYGHCVF